MRSVSKKSPVYSNFTVVLQKFEGYSFSEEIFPQHFLSGNKYPYQGKGKKKREKKNKPSTSHKTACEIGTQEQGFKAS